MRGEKKGRHGRGRQVKNTKKKKETKSLAKSPHILLTGKGILLGTCHAAFHAGTVSFCFFFFQPSNSAQMHHVGFLPHSLTNGKWNSVCCDSLCNFLVLNHKDCTRKQTYISTLTCTKPSSKLYEQRTLRCKRNGRSS